MELNDLSSWTINDFTAENIRKVTSQNLFEKELIKEIGALIYKEASIGGNKLNLDRTIPVQVEQFFIDKGFRVSRGNSITIQKDNYYGSINW